MEDKQTKFLEEWTSGEGIEFENAAAKDAYLYRTSLFKDAIQLQKAPDRVPIYPIVTFAPMYVMNVKHKDAMYDADVLGKVYYDFTAEYDVDAANTPVLCNHGPTLEAIDYDMYKWAGHGLPDNTAYQFVEKEYMKVEEYDHLIQDPTDFMIRVYMGRIAKALKPLGNVSDFFGLQEITLANGLFISLGAPDVQEALHALMKAGKSHFDWINKLAPYLNKITGTGYPFGSGGATKVPFDFLGDTLRGTTQLMMDMYRRPEKVLEACERLVPHMVRMGASAAHANKNPLIFIPLHKGADGFMSDAQFQKFYWPNLKALMNGLIAEGCVPVCFVEGAYNDRLEYLTDIPKGKSVFYFDKTDMAKARKTLDGIACIGGGFPVSQILTGNAQSVADGTKKLLDDAAGDGGYILGIGCSMDEAKDETLKSFIKTGKEYGKY